jgi:hypothetical protein
LPLDSVVIGILERLALLFGIADLPIANDTQMTAPTSAKAELTNLKIQRNIQQRSLQAASALDRGWFATRAVKHSERLRGAWWA